MSLYTKTLAVIGILSFLIGIAILAREVYWLHLVPLWEPPMVGIVLAWAGIPLPDTGWLELDHALLLVYTWDAILTFAVGIPGVAVILIVQQRVLKRLR